MVWGDKIKKIFYFKKIFEGIFFYGLIYVFNVFDVFGLWDLVLICGWGVF